MARATRPRRAASGRCRPRVRAAGRRGAGAQRQHRRSTSTLSARSRPRNIVVGARARRRPADARGLPRRARSSRRAICCAADRSAAVPVQLTQAQRADGDATRRSSRTRKLDLERYRTLLAQDSISKQQVDTQEALVRQYRGHGPGPTRARSTTPGCSSPIRVSPRRSAAASACARSIPATSVHASDSNGLVTHHAGSAVADQSTRCRRTTCRASSSACRATSPSRSMRCDRGSKIKLATGTLLTIDNQIDTTTGTVKLKAEFPNDDSALFPEPVRQRAHGASKTQQDATLVPTRRDPARRARARSSSWSRGDQDGRGDAGQDSARSQGETTEIAERARSPGNLVVVDGADKLRDRLERRADRRAPRGAPQQAAPPRATRRRAAASAASGQGRRTSSGG